MHWASGKVSWKRHSKVTTLFLSLLPSTFMPLLSSTPRLLTRVLISAPLPPLPPLPSPPLPSHLLSLSSPPPPLTGCMSGCFLTATLRRWVTVSRQCSLEACMRCSPLSLQGLRDNYCRCDPPLSRKTRSSYQWLPYTLPPPLLPTHSLTHTHSCLLSCSLTHFLI